jgi:hypothetical protein
MSTNGSATLQPSYRALANPTEFEDFLSGNGALADRDVWAKAADYNHRVRKLDFERHFRALVLLHTTDRTSGHDLTDAAEEAPLFKAVRSDFDISVSGFGDAMADRPIEPFWQMLKRVMQAVEDLEHQRLRGIDAETWDKVTGLFSEIDLFDATSMELPPSLCEWAESEPDASRIEMHLKLSGLDGRFQEAITTRPGGNGNTEFGDLLDLEEDGGHVYVFDAGYFDIDQYHAITDTGNFFVTKLHGNIEPESVCQRPVPDEYTDAGGRTDCGYAVFEDRYVRLTGREMWYRVLTVKVSTDKTIEILTNLLWLDAAQICRLYHHRWSIEIVFRWLKDRLQLDHFVSRDPRGIIRQIVTALIVWGLLTIYNRGNPDFRPKELLREVRRAMEQAIFDFGRRCQKHGVDPFD